MPLPDYVTPEYLSKLALREGCGTGAPGDRCAIQEVRAWEGLDPASDGCPPDADPLIVALVIRVQDASPVWRAALVPLLLSIPGSRGSEALQWRRLYRYADWQIRQVIPALCDRCPELRDSAAALRSLAPIVDRQTAQLAVDQLALARAFAHDRALARACALDLALALARDIALDIALDIDLARALALALDIDRALARALVALIAEMLAMSDDA
jgi:hypothetical protein